MKPDDAIRLMLTGRLPEREPDPPPAMRSGGMRVCARHFTAGLVVRNYRVVEFAPILKYMRGWHPEQVVRYCESKGWRLEQTPDR